MKVTVTTMRNRVTGAQDAQTLCYGHVRNYRILTDIERGCFSVHTPEGGQRNFQAHDEVLDYLCGDAEDQYVWAVAATYETAHACYGGDWEAYVDEYLRSTDEEDQTDGNLADYLDAYGDH